VGRVSAQDGGQAAHQLALTALSRGNCPRRIDKADVAESLRKVSEKLASSGVHFFGKKTDVVREAGGASKCFFGLLHPASQRQRLRKPERAQEKRSFLTCKPVMCAITVN